MTDPNASEGTKGRILVWDLPARVSHWGFALSLTASLVIGFKTDPESVIFKGHILAGVLACWFLLVRLVLGFVGSPPMRWRAFFKEVTQLRVYVKEVWAWRAVDRVGLNAGSAIFALLLYLAVIAVFYTGFVPDFVETWHGRLAYLCVLLIAVHLGGLLAHALRHRDLSLLAMVHGRVKGRTGDGLKTQNTAAGWTLIALGFVMLWLLWHYFDETTSVLQIPFFPEISFPVIQKG